MHPEICSMRVAEAAKQQRCIDIQVLRAASLSGRPASTAPSSAKLTRPWSKAASPASERFPPLLRRRQAALGGLRDGPQRIERAGAEIAVDDPHGGEGGSRRGWLIDPRRRTMLLKRNLGHRHLRDVVKAA
jgi:hypothetical protein